MLPPCITLDPPSGVPPAAVRRQRRRRSRMQCRHNNTRESCAECKKAICVHFRQRSICRDCKGASICPHMKRRTRCVECGGGSICKHGRRRCKCKDPTCVQIRKGKAENPKRDQSLQARRWDDWATLPRFVLHATGEQTAPRSHADACGTDQRGSSATATGSSVPLSYAVNYPERALCEPTSTSNSMSRVGQGNSFSFQQKAPESFKVGCPSPLEPAPEVPLTQTDPFDATVLASTCHDADPQDKGSWTVTDLSYFSDLSGALTDADSPAAITFAELSYLTG